MPPDYYPYRWAWRVRPLDKDGNDYMGKPCRVLVRAHAMNSVLVEFEDGQKFVTSRNGLRRLT